MTSFLNQLSQKKLTSSVEWISLIGVFLCAGIIGHDPWRLHEPYMFGVIDHFYTTHTWLVPVNGNHIFMEKPPLYYWTGVVLCRLLGDMLPLHDAARIASLLYMAFTTLFLWKTSQVLFAAREEHKALGWISIAFLLGQLGIVQDAHLMKADIPTMTGTIIALYGIALIGFNNKNWKKAGVWIGLGVGVAFMSKGAFAPGVLILSGLISWFFIPALHSQNTWRALGISVLVAFPFIVIWPGLLYRYSPELFIQCFWNNNVGRFLGFFSTEPGIQNDRYKFVFNLLRNTFPAWPFALQRVIVERKQWRALEYILPASTIAVGLLTLIISATGNGWYTLPLMPSFALLAAPMTLRLSKKFLVWLNLAIRFLASAAALYMGVVWVTLHYPQKLGFFSWVTSKTGFDYTYNPAVMQDQKFACLMALCVILLWVFSFRLSLRLAINTAYIWFAAVSLVWVMLTLFFPWENQERSYRQPLMDMVKLVNQFPGEHNCVEADYYDELVTPMYYYIAKPLLPPRRDEETCPFLFSPSYLFVPSATQWRLIWTGTRSGPLKDEIKLYQAVTGH